MVRIEGLKKWYGERCVLDIPSFSFEKGGVYTIFGPNGAGKTTLLNILGLLEEPSAGKVFFGKEQVNTSSILARRRISHLFQDPFLFSGTVFFNVNFGLWVRRKRDRDKVLSVLDEVGMRGFENRDVKTLSGGEAKRVALARCLVTEPELLLLDEPEANIDPESLKMIEELIRKRNRERGVTVISTTTNPFAKENLLSLIDGMIKRI
jgi:tungstate transport system ATP-binding protein